MATPNFGLATDLMIGTCFINYKTSGWSEKYILCGGSSDPAFALLTYSQAAAKFYEVLGHRAVLLGLGCKITWARVSKWSVNGESLPAFSAPMNPGLVDPEVTVEKINDPEVNFNFRFDDGAGRFALRSIRGLRDSWVEDFDLLSTITTGVPVDTAAYATPIGLATAVTPSNAIDNFVLSLKKNTVGVRKSNIPATPHLVFPLTFNMFRGVHDRQTGRPFGMSRGKARNQV